MTEIPDSKTQIDQLREAFNAKSQRDLADILGVGRNLLTEWKNRLNGIPSKRQRQIYTLARERNVKLPDWFPAWPDQDRAA